MRPHTPETLDDDEDDILSSDGSGSEKSSLDVDPIHRDGNGQDIACGAEALDPDATLPSPGPGQGQNGAKPHREIVTWKDMPMKTQLVVIMLARLSEPLTQTSLQVSLDLFRGRGFPGGEVYAACGNPFRRRADDLHISFRSHTCTTS